MENKTQKQPGKSNRRGINLNHLAILMLAIYTLFALGLQLLETSIQTKLFFTVNYVLLTVLIFIAISFNKSTRT